MRRPGIDSPAFETACEVLERLTRMTRLEARGTLRITLREAGLDTSVADPREIARVATSALVPELAARGVAGAGEVCHQLALRLLGDPAEELPPDASGPAVAP